MSLAIEGLPKKVDRRVFLRGLGHLSMGLAASTTVVVVKYELSGLDNALRVVRWIGGEQVDCAGSIEPSNKSGYPYDAIAVPGAGVVFENGMYVPNDHGKLRIEAAAIKYILGAASRVILLDGNGDPAHSGAGKNYFKKIYHDFSGGEALPEDVIVEEHKSINTATNMMELNNIVVKKGFRKVLLVTNEYHETRAELLACQNHIAASSENAEEIIKDWDPDRKEEIIAMYHTPQMGDTQSKELVKVMISIVDPRGYVSILGRKITGKRF